MMKNRVYHLIHHLCFMYNFLFNLKITFGAHVDGTVAATLEESLSRLPEVILFQYGSENVGISVYFQNASLSYTKVKSFNEVKFLHVHNPLLRGWALNLFTSKYGASRRELVNSPTSVETQIQKPSTPAKDRNQKIVLVTNYKTRRKRHVALINATEEYFNEFLKNSPESLGILSHPLIGTNHPITIEVTPSNDTLISVYFASIPQDLAILVNLPAAENTTEHSAILITMIPGSPPSYSGTITFISSKSNSTVGFHIPPSPNGAVITVDVPQELGVPQFRGRKTKIRLVHLGGSYGANHSAATWESTSSSQQSVDIVTNVPTTLWPSVLMHSSSAGPGTEVMEVTRISKSTSDMPSSLVTTLSAIPETYATEVTISPKTISNTPSSSVSTSAVTMPSSRFSSESLSTTSSTNTERLPWTTGNTLITERTAANTPRISSTERLTAKATPTTEITKRFPPTTQKITTIPKTMTSTLQTSKTIPIITSTLVPWTTQGISVTPKTTTSMSRPMTEATFSAPRSTQRATVSTQTLTPRIISSTPSSTSNTPFSMPNLITTISTVSTIAGTTTTKPITVQTSRTTVATHVNATTEVPTAKNVPSIAPRTIATTQEMSTKPRTTTAPLKTTQMTTTATVKMVTTEPKVSDGALTKLKTTVTSPSMLGSTTRASYSSTSTSTRTLTSTKSPTSTSTSTRTSTSTGSPTSTSTRTSTSTGSPTSTSTRTSTSKGSPTSTSTRTSMSTGSPTSTSTSTSTSTGSPTSTSTRASTSIGSSTTSTSTRTSTSTGGPTSTSTKSSTSTGSPTSTSTRTSLSAESPTSTSAKTSTSTGSSTSTSTRTSISTGRPTSTSSVAQTRPATTVSSTITTTRTKTSTSSVTISGTVVTRPETTSFTTRSMPRTMPTSVLATTRTNTWSEVTTSTRSTPKHTQVATSSVTDELDTSTVVIPPCVTLTTAKTTRNSSPSTFSTWTSTATSASTSTGSRITTAKPTKLPVTTATLPVSRPTKLTVPPATYWLRTVIQAKPEEINASFVAEMKEHLRKAYEDAFFHQQRVLLGLIVKRRIHRQLRSSGFLNVEMINVTARSNSAEVDMVYYLLHNGSLIPVVMAVKAMENLDEQEAAIIFGHIVVIKAEPYLSEPTSEPLADDKQSVVLPAVLGSIAALLLLILLAIILHQCVCRRKRANSTDLFGHGQRNRQKAFEEDVTSSVVTIEQGEGSKSNSGNIWTPVHKGVSQIISTNTPPIPKRNRQRRSHRPLPSLPGNVDYANLTVHASSTEKLVDDTPPPIKRGSVIRRKRVPVDVYRADDREYDDVPLAGGIFEHLKPVGYKATYGRRGQKESESEKQEESDRPSPRPRTSVQKSTESTDRLPAATQTEESTLTRPLNLECSMSQPQSSYEMDLLQAEMQMQTMRHKMQEVLDDAFSFWKDRKLSPRFHRGRLQPSVDDAQPQDQERGGIGLNLPFMPRNRLPRVTSEENLDTTLVHPLSSNSASLRYPRKNWMLDNDRIPEEQDVPMGFSADRRAAPSIRTGKKDVYHSDPALLLNPGTLSDYTANSPSNQNIRKPDSLSFLEPDIHGKGSSQNLTPVNGEKHTEFPGYERIHRDPETQYLIKAIKKELHKFRTSYDSDVSLV